MRKITLFSLLLAFFLPGQGWAVLEIEITQGVEGALPIAIVPFAGNAKLQSTAINNVVSANLQSSGHFSIVDPAKFPQRPLTARDVNYDVWRQAEVEALLIGNIIQVSPDQYRIEFELFDLVRKKRAFGHAITSTSKAIRKVSHKISDLVFEYLTGMRGAFSTRVAYVSVLKQGDKGKRYVLQIADADGYNPRTIFSSPKELMSPSWAPDGRRLAYVSFEKDRPQIYVQDIITGKKELLVSEPGINSAPAWSPDGKFVALTLSSSGNPEVYVLDVASKRLRRLTRHRAIDTEPSWMPDGRTLLFTSDRSGGPQIYSVPVAGGKPRRLTFDGNYNAAPTIAPDGKSVAFVHSSGRGYQIGILDPQRRDMRVLTQGRLDESPSFAPNGSMIIYATREGRRSVLAAVSADGRVKQTLRLQEGEVREPAWSPFR